jgi:alkylation response protein AidB-like acyl-CoA dehydrogenase
MPTNYKAPIADLKFVLHDLLELGSDASVAPFERATPEVTDAVLGEAAKLIEEVVAPINQIGDSEGCRFEDGSVQMPTGFPEAYEQYSAAGWGGLTAELEYGGQGLPYSVGLAVNEMISAANLAFAITPELTRGAYEAIFAHGTDEQRRRYLPRLVSGEWTGTMNLTEPHAGTDVGLLRTRAVPCEDGDGYLITGTKIFISAGEHDMSDNIVHLVLARIDGAPEGVRGVSLFLVPKFHVNEDGLLGERTGPDCGSIEDKMGIHGSPTCVMNYEDAIGELVGEPHTGMRQMFTMMNAARIGVGVQGLGVAEIAYQNAVAYARERPQGRSLSGPKEPEQAADPIIVHPDVRRMLMTARAFTEGARALALWTGMHVDIARCHPDEQQRQEADDLVALMTPMVKAYLTDTGYECANMALQCFGGHGYIREMGMEQFVRDARITQIYEGANGVQALDLVGRKLVVGEGRLVRGFLDRVSSFVAEHSADAALAEFVTPLVESVGELEQSTTLIMERGMQDPDEAGAASSDYLKMYSLVTLSYLWARMASVARAALADGEAVDAERVAFMERKLVTARFFMGRVLPEVHSLAAKIEAGGESMMALAADDF